MALKSCELISDAGKIFLEREEDVRSVWPSCRDLRNGSHGVFLRDNRGSSELRYHRDPLAVQYSALKLSILKTS
jgi:hypothetical protein